MGLRRMCSLLFALQSVLPSSLGQDECPFPMWLGQVGCDLLTPPPYLHLVLLALALPAPAPIL